MVKKVATVMGWVSIQPRWILCA